MEYRTAPPGAGSGAAEGFATCRFFGTCGKPSAVLSPAPAAFKMGGDVGRFCEFFTFGNFDL